VLSKGRYFYYFQPITAPDKLLSPPEQVYLYPYNLYHIGDEDLKEKSIIVNQAILIPAFIYFISQTHDEKGREYKNILNYPPLVKYSRNNNNITIKAIELRFEINSELILITEHKEQRFQINKHKQSFTLDTSIIKSDFTLLLKQDNFYYLLEKFEIRPQNHFRTQTVNSLTPFTYLSLKNILDPDHGMERLIQNINENKFQLKTGNSHKMKKLLNIIRAADFSDEQKILSSIFLHDKPLFKDIMKNIFSDDLLPYMDSREVQQILYNAPDEIIHSISNLSPELKKKYSQYISKNRYKELVEDGNITQNISDSSSLIKSHAWSYIESWYRERRECTINLVTDKDIIFFKIDPEGEPKYFNLIQKQKNWLNKYSPVRTIGNIENSIFVKSEIRLNQCSIYYSLNRKNFYFIHFKNIEPGIIQLNLPMTPAIIIIGATDHSFDLIEGISFNLNHFKK